MYNIEELEERLLSELKDIAEKLSINNYKKLQKKELIYKILDQQAITPENQLPQKPQIMKEEKQEEPVSSSSESNSESDFRRRPCVKRENVKEIEVSKEEVSNSSDLPLETFKKVEETAYIPPRVSAVE